MLLHPALSLFNAGPIDYGKKFKFYKEGATPQICQVLEQIEVELNEIFQCLGLRQLRYEKWAGKCYGINANCIHEAIQKIEAYKDINAPDHLITRYFTEDVPTGLVAISSLGRFFGIKTPTIDSIIHLSSIICGTDFLKEGRTVERLELEDYLRKRIKRKGYLTEELNFNFKYNIRITKDDI